MESLSQSNEKRKFITDLPIVEATNSPLRHIVSVLLMILLSLMLFLGGIAGTFWIYDVLTKPGNIFSKAGSVIIYLLVLLFALVAPWSVIQVWRETVNYRKLKQEGVTTKAKIVGKDYYENTESADDYYIYYQFRPDFVVKYNDVTSGYIYYNQPEESEINVLYLPSDPRINTLEF